MTPTLSRSRKFPRQRVDRKTIVRNEQDFFPVIKLGDKRWVVSKAYEAWLARIYAGIDNGRAA